jgi:hypothetical protein
MQEITGHNICLWGLRIAAKVCTKRQKRPEIDLVWSKNVPKRGLLAYLSVMIFFRSLAQPAAALGHEYRVTKSK